MTRDQNLLGPARFIGSAFIVARLPAADLGIFIGIVRWRLVEIIVESISGRQRRPIATDAIHLDVDHTLFKRPFLILGAERTVVERAQVARKHRTISVKVEVEVLALPSAFDAMTVEEWWKTTRVDR